MAGKAKIAHLDTGGHFEKFKTWKDRLNPHGKEILTDRTEMEKRSLCILQAEKERLLD